jgi:site-specific DNA-methyltransferase (adenine-specific)
MAGTPPKGGVLVSAAAASRKYRMNISNTIFKGDALELIKMLPDKSVDLCLTDPPYHIHGMGSHKWNITPSTSHIALPSGMKFSKNQGLELHSFMMKISQQVFRVLKPGGFYISFSQARLYHNMASAIENSGFDIRDMIGWCYKGQPKAFSMDHVILKRRDISDDEKQRLIAEMKGWKTPQLMPCIEPAVFAQKPPEGTFVDNWIKYKTGLINTAARFEGKFPGNIIEIPKPSKREKGEDNTHPTVKPLQLFEQLIKLCSLPQAVVLDPFIGSGTTGVAALKWDRRFIGFELDPKYVEIARRRIDVGCSCERSSSIH